MAPFQKIVPRKRGSSLAAASASKRMDNQEQSSTPRTMEIFIHRTPLWVDLINIRNFSFTPLCRNPRAFTCNSYRHHDPEEWAPINILKREIDHVGLGIHAHRMSVRHEKCAHRTKRLAVFAINRVAAVTRRGKTEPTRLSSESR